MDEKDMNEYELNEDDDSIDIIEEDADNQSDGQKELNLLNEKYTRLYADFENYKKRMNKDKEELIRYGNESLLYELLPAMDHLELALKHSGGESLKGLVQGVEMTLKELLRALEKFGLTRIEATGRSFDPAVHHAMSQIESSIMDENMVAEEFRTGYLYRDKVLRPSLVAVSVKPKEPAKKQESESGNDEDPNRVNINIINNTEEEE